MSQVHFQDLVFALQRYWGRQGCAVLQPLDIEVGAGTFHPATFLRSLGFAPWRCVYVQPSRRPGDGRYGENPNRLGMHHQLQVILKPSPDDVQDRYLGSLEAVGIDLRRHDVRFVKDDWESPTLGAWGLGWEVWLDGMEVTQFTYFQQAGGHDLARIPVELTYGLERLAMYLQGVDDVFDLTWVEGLRYREVFHRNEREQSVYAFERADVDALFAAFGAAREACLELAAEGLALPAYDQCCKASHAFNLLEARGALSVAERAERIRQVRELACRCADAWLAGLEEADPSPAAPSAPAVDPAVRPVGGPAPLLVEVLCEELPAGEIGPALAALARGLEDLLAEVPHGAVRTFSTPRRLAVEVLEVAPTVPVREELVTGPPLAAARGPDGWTRAALGFARARGVRPEDLEIVDGPRGRVVAARVRRGGRPVGELLVEGLERVVLGLPFARTMRWGEGRWRWARPIHRLLVVHGGEVVPVRVAGRDAVGTVAGHRLAESPPAPVADGAGYLRALEERHVLADRAARRARILEGLREAAAGEGVELYVDERLLEEVTDLVEWPVVVVGRLDPSFLELPPRLLVETMRVHQRVFPTWREGALAEVFLAVSNNPHGDAATIARGNARVLAARFHDARFFYAEDRKVPLAEHGRGLSAMRWVRGMGTMADRQERLARLAPEVARRLGVERAAEAAARAAALCKADLLTQMVGEFPELQGHMGRLYAEHAGEPPEVALAIEEHYLPRHAGDALPGSDPGRVLAVAERLDVLAGCFAAGLQPRGNADPQGLRRAAAGLVAILADLGRSAPLGPLLELAWNNLEGRGRVPVGEGLPALRAFVLERLRSALVAGGHRRDVVDAVLATGVDDPVAIRARVEAIAGRQAEGGFDTLAATFKRVLNIARDHAEAAYDPDRFLDPAEGALAGALEAARGRVQERLAAGDAAGALGAMAELEGPVARFFDAVLVMADDPAVRANRLGLLRAVADTFLALADFRRIVASG